MNQHTSLSVRILSNAERAIWEPLWQDYLTFYETTLDPAIIDITWQRLNDPAEPMYVLGAFDNGSLVGIVHYLFHRSTWTIGSYCYLQDLFTSPLARGKGVARLLIASVAQQAREAGAGRVHWLTHESNTQAQALYDKLAERPGFIQYRIRF
ncbi:Acetyltransferase%2C GNAT family [Yersinia frederiksenii]|nr:Acetyltransferase%2C GNAT family [Yersinia frederiksenii]